MPRLPRPIGSAALDPVWTDQKIRETLRKDFNEKANPRLEYGHLTYLTPRSTIPEGFKFATEDPRVTLDTAKGQHNHGHLPQLAARSTIPEGFKFATDDPSIKIDTPHGQHLLRCSDSLFLASRKQNRYVRTRLGIRFQDIAEIPAVLLASNLQANSHYVVPKAATMKMFLTAYVDQGKPRLLRGGEHRFPCNIVQKTSIVCRNNGIHMPTLLVEAYRDVEGETWAWDTCGLCRMFGKVDGCTVRGTPVETDEVLARGWPVAPIPATVRRTKRQVEHESRSVLGDHLAKYKDMSDSDDQGPRTVIVDPKGKARSPETASTLQSVKHHHASSSARPSTSRQQSPAKTSSSSASDDYAIIMPSRKAGRVLQQLRGSAEKGHQSRRR